ncbi:unnamed protein product [Brassica oleracea]|uniref:(rape) hypothetical protein n=1 Tax=Brassica napus TaxID=3708 RepID=A0A816IDF2_BRANA|nr:unnamed protein product [Brassica napus]
MPEMFHGLSKNGDEQERTSKIIRKISVELENEFQSPTFGYKATTSSPSPLPSVRYREEIAWFLGVGEERRILFSKFRVSGGPTEDLVLSDPSSDEEGPEERETTNWCNEKSKPGFSSAKRNSNLKDNGRVVLSPTSSLSKAGIHRIDSFQQFSEMEEDEGLGRSLVDITNEIHLRLENVKSHIITEAYVSSIDYALLFFIEGHVGHHLEDLQSTIEELEASHSELNGTIKKQRTSHQKLMTHFEGGIETKLDNATKRITYVNESAKRKMVQLKMVVVECLKDGISEPMRYNLNSNVLSTHLHILDLYETEYDEGFKKNIKNLGGSQVVPNVEVITAPPDEQSIAVGRSAELYFASSSMLSGGTSRDLKLLFFKKEKSDDGSDDGKTRVTATTRKTVAKKKRSTEVHKLSERKRRNEISKKLCELQDLLPNCYKMMSMGNGIIPSTSTMLAMGHYSPTGLRMHMGEAATTTSVPQFLPMNLQGTGFSRINEASSQMLSNFLNHHTGLIPNSPIFSPLESCSHQFVVPSCFPGTHSTSFTPFSKSAPTSNLEDAMQFKGSNGY